METILKVEGMMCSHCAARIEKALGNLGISPEIDVENKTVSLDSGNVSVDEIVTAISDIGYDAKVI